MQMHRIGFSIIQKWESALGNPSTGFMVRSADLFACPNCQGELRICCAGKCTGDSNTPVKNHTPNLVSAKVEKPHHRRPKFP